jgi:DNA-binding response OmpR family regulator
MTEVLMLVEADATVRQPLADYLRECGFKVFEAVSGVEAIEALKDRNFRVSIVLADAANTGCGFELARWLRTNRPAVEVILTGSVAMALEKAGELCESVPALVKAYEHRFVLDHIRRLIARRRSLARDIW